MATNEKKDKKSESPSLGGSEASREVGQKFKDCKNTEIPHLGSLPIDPSPLLVFVQLRFLGDFLVLCSSMIQVSDRGGADFSSALCCWLMVCRDITPFPAHSLHEPSKLSPRNLGKQ